MYNRKRAEKLTYLGIFLGDIAGVWKKSGQIGLIEIIADAVGDCLGDAVLEGTASQQGGFAAVREITHFDEDRGTSGVCQDVVIGRLDAEAVKTCAGHRARDGTCRFAGGG